uniref:HTH psq-type domain-containing protein n=1 Tax=Amphimedon queenslandica TaxID=400682 RepID=A0A1X7T9Q4_AMPQE
GTCDAATNHSGRLYQYKLWTDSNLYKVYLAVQKDGVSVRRAAEMYNIPKSTLHDSISGHVQFGSTSGPESYLSEEENQSNLLRYALILAFSYKKSNY